MEWNQIVNKARLIKEEFERTYKCLNVDRPIREETIRLHFNNLFKNLEKIRVLFNVYYNRLTLSHQAAADAFFLDLKNKITKIAAKKAITIELPNSIHESEPYNFTIPSTTDTMTQTIVEFLNTASKLITDFDGKPENLTSFIDSLNLVDTIKGQHELAAVSLIKTKLKGTARNLITNESNISDIITKLKVSVKGESVEVLSAKIMSTKQFNKTPNAYCNEIENLAKSLENAYISDGLPCQLATKYSTQVAVKALTKNCTLDKVKLIMEAGQFNSLNEAVGKFINSCTEATGQQNAILYFGQKPNNNFRGNYVKFNKRKNYPRYNNDNNNTNNSNNTNRNNFNNRNQQRYNNNQRTRNYVRATDSNENDSENSNHPLRETQ